MHMDPPPLRRTSAFDGLDRRAVTELDLAAHSLAVVCPSGSALSLAFVLPGLVGPGAWLSVLIGFGVAQLLATAFGQFGARVTAAGSLYTYTAKGLGSLAALLVGISLILGYGVLTSFGIAASGRRVEASWSAFSGTDDLPWLAVAGAVAVVCLCLWAMGKGIRWSTRLVLIGESVALGCLLVVLVATALRYGLPDLAALSLAGAEPHRVLLGAALIMTITVGFESSAALGVESERPFRTVPLSWRRTIWLTAILFLVSVVINTGAAGDRGAGRVRWFNPGASQSFADGLVLLALVVPFAMLALCAWTALARLVYSLARDGLLPDLLGVAHATTRVPRAATWAALPVVTLPIVVTVLSGHPVGWATKSLLETATVILCVAYVLTALAVLPFLHRIDELDLRQGLVAVAAATGVAVLTGVVVHADSMTGRWWVLGTVATVLLAGLSWWAWLRRHRPQVLAKVGTHDAPLLSEVLVDPVLVGRDRG